MTSDIFYYTKEYNILGFMISLDFQKAFDSLEHNFLDVILNKFNFLTLFVWMDSYLFILSLEMLAILIRD